jgi:broad specificity phosphatase PhoE
MRFHWVRHGPTHARGMVGWSDLPADLSDTGRIARLAAELPGGALVISSDLLRSVATADAICRDRERLPHDPDLREMSFGDWEMKTSAQIMETHPDLSRAFWTDPGATCPPGGESWDALTARTSAAVARLMAAHPGRDMVVVAHIGVILSQVAAATGRPAKEVIGQKIDNLSVTELHWNGAGWALGRINHLP